MNMINPCEFFSKMNQMGMQMMGMMMPKCQNNYADMFKQQAQNMMPDFQQMQQVNQLMAGYTANMFEMTKQMNENMYKQNMQFLESLNELLQKNFQAGMEKHQEATAAKNTAKAKKTTAKEEK